MALYHINFHTLYSKPIFEDEAYDSVMRICLRTVMREHKVLCVGWEVMPTHVHLIVEEFPDQPRSAIIRTVKGGTSYAFFGRYPDLRDDLLGGHLWTKGYYFVAIETHEQLVNTLNYVRSNRQNADLPPPKPLAPA